jgi:xyloglucan-specific exo-beta-1,4-glucanase
MPVQAPRNIASLQTDSPYRPSRSHVLLGSLVAAASIALCGCGGSSSSHSTTQAAAPSFSPVAGTFTSAQTVSITDSTAGATIHYTTDGSTPTAASASYTAPLPVATTTTLQALATAPNYAVSPVTTAAYTINLPVVTPAPAISPNGGTLSTAQTIALADSVSGAAIYYTLDGSTPTASSPAYSAPFTLPNSGSVTVSAIAIAPGQTVSSVTSATFTVTVAVSSTPTYTYKNVQIVGGGFVDGLYFHPKSQGLMYAKTDIGGAYRWNNVTGGDSQWVPLLNFVGRFYSGFDQGVESLAIDPNDPARLYLAVGEYADSYGQNGTILISDDMGNTFTNVPLPIKFGSNDIGRNIGERLVVDPNNGRHLYLATRLNGLYESFDRAQTWSQVASFPVKGPSATTPEDPEVGVIFEDFIASSGTAANGNTKTVYVGVSSPTIGLYVSNDGGVTFTAVTGQPTGFYPNATSIDTTNNILYLSYGLNTTANCSPNCDHSGPYGPNSGQVWKYQLPSSQQPSGTWTQITPPQTTPSGGAYGFGSVVVDPNHPNVVMVTTLNKYYPDPGDDVFRSSDAGATWYNIDTNIVRDASLAIWTDFGNVDSNGNPQTQPGNWLNHLVIDPFNSNHVMLGNGQTIWQSTDIESADGVATNPSVTAHGNTTHWSIGALGLEETDITDLVSPPSGPANLLSEMGDLGGFTHTDLTVSPASGVQRPPLFTTGSSTDFAQSNPLYVVRVGTSTGTNGTFNQPTGSLIGSYSNDGGITWTQFATNPAGVTSGGGTISVSADGSTIVWLPSDVGVAASYSTDNGTTWAAATGAPAQINNYMQETIFADRFNAKKFYIFNPQGSNGGTPIYVSTDGAHSFVLASTPADYGIALYVSPAAEGDLWLAAYNGLFHSTDAGLTFTQVTGTQVAYNLGFGLTAPGSTYPTIYMVGQQSSDTACNDGSDPTLFFTPTTSTTCIYRSVDEGKTFVRINDFAHQYAYINTITGDARVFGRIYLGTAGRGIVEGDSPN